MAIRFSASGESLSISSPPSGDITIMGWLRMTSDRGTYATMFAVGGAWGSGMRHFDLDSGDEMHLYNGDTEDNGTSLSIETWYHVCLTDSDSNDRTRGYLNGALDVTVTRSANRATDTMYVGNNYNDEWQDGRMACIKVWNAELTADEILQEMHSIRPVTNLDTLWLWTPGFPGSGERARDYSGNGRDWTENGTLTDEDPPPVSWGAPSLFAVLDGGVAYSLDAAQGALGLAGQATGLLTDRNVVAAQGTLGFSGQSAGLAVDRLLTAEQGSLSLSGQAGSLTVARLLTAAQGSIVLSGQATDLYRGFLVVAAQGSLSLSGQSAELALDRLLVAAQGTLSLSGQVAGLAIDRLLTAAQGSLSLAGVDATLIYSGVSDYTLVAAQGLLSISGQATELYRGLNLSADQGSLSLAGQSAGILRGYPLAAEAGVLGLTGQAVGFTLGRLLAAGYGTITFSGQSAGLTYSGVTITTPDGRIFAIIGEDRIFVVAAENRIFVVKE
jgi:hypothetical protein